MCGQIGSDLRVCGRQTQGQWVVFLNPKLELHSAAGCLGMAPSTHLACGPGLVPHLPLLKRREARTACSTATDFLWSLTGVLGRAPDKAAECPSLGWFLHGLSDACDCRTFRALCSLTHP